MLQKIQKYLPQIHNLFATNKLSLQLEALSNCVFYTSANYGRMTFITIIFKKNMMLSCYLHSQIV